MAAAVSVQCGGASTSAKLAIGGISYDEYDPNVILCNPPLEGVLMKMWDQPTSRRSFVHAWYSARAAANSDAPGSPWSRVRGPVGAAWLHLTRIGAAWPKPFVVHALGHDINITVTPPKQVMAVLRAQARLHEDLLLIDRLAKRWSWDADAVKQRYVHGIDWYLLRCI
jgi:hypothetical protein